MQRAKIHEIIDIKDARVKANSIKVLKYSVFKYSKCKCKVKCKGKCKGKVKGKGKGKGNMLKSLTKLVILESKLLSMRESPKE